MRVTNKTVTMEVGATTALDFQAIDRLEERVERAVSLIESLRAERDALRAQVDAASAVERQLRAELTESQGNGHDIARFEKEREGLLRDRATMARKVEAILERMEGMGLK